MDDRALAEWLSLREPIDARSRSAALTQRVSAAVATRDPLHVLDLGTGAGSNVRYLAARLPARQQHWAVVDRSHSLLTVLADRMAGWDNEIQIEQRQRDLRVLDDDLFTGRHLVTASALLDLVSDAWLASLAAHCRRHRSAVLFALTYNGHSHCDPVEPEDELILDLFNRHQRTDKGLGGPAGPDAPAHALARFAAEGYQVVSERSDWFLGSDDTAVQRILIDGWAQASTEIAPETATTIVDWRLRRLGHVDANRSRIVVSHDDIAAWLP